MYSDNIVTVRFVTFCIFFTASVALPGVTMSTNANGTPSIQPAAPSEMPPTPSPNVMDFGDYIMDGLAKFQISPDSPIYADLGIVFTPATIDDEEIIEAGHWSLSDESPLSDHFVTHEYDLQFFEIDTQPKLPGTEILFLAYDSQITDPMGFSLLLFKTNEGKWRIAAEAPLILSPVQVANQFIFIASETMRGTGVYFTEETVYTFSSELGFVEVLCYPVGKGYWDGWCPINMQFDGDASLDILPGENARLSIALNATYTVAGDDSRILLDKQDVSVWELSATGDFKHVSGIGKTELKDIPRGQELDGLLSSFPEKRQ